VLGAQPACELDALESEVGRDDSAALQPRELGDELSDNSQPEDDDRFSQTDLGSANRVQGNAAQSRKARLVQRHTVRHRHDQMTTCSHRLGMA
jgi:hypothetical protein